MFEAHDSSVIDALSKSGLLSSEQLGELHWSRRKTGRNLAAAILESGIVGRRQLLESVADYLQFEFLPDLPESIPDEVTGAISHQIAHKYAVVPLRICGQSIDLATVDPFNYRIIEDLTFFLNRDIQIVVCDPDRVVKLIDQTYGELKIRSTEVLAESESEPISKVEDNGNGSSVMSLSEDTPVIRFVDLVLAQAIEDHASDIHFEPFEDQFRIRCRVDGALREMAPPPGNLVQPITARLKVMANLNIAEQRVPQDGRIRMTVAGRPVDLRISTLPTRFGESIVLRILDKTVVSLDLDRLNLPSKVVHRLRRVASLPHGLFIVTGPTGCGKTTTLYSLLREINRPEIKILTIEDPVEYEIEGIMQVAVNPQIDLSFSRALRSFLRHDPDKILVGEIRDLETARIAVQASLTGHLVLTTLHTNNAPGAVTRLIDMGLEPYLLAATLDTVLAQRLLRKICNNCRQPQEPSSELVAQLGMELSQIEETKFYTGNGCPDCRGEGFLGRIGLFELLAVSDVFRKLIVDNAPTYALEKHAREEGMTTLREDGLRVISEGFTTIEEVLKYT